MAGRRGVSSTVRHSFMDYSTQTALKVARGF